MFVIIWEFRVRPQRVAEFEKIYGENGSWVKLFQKGSGYLRTELLHDPDDLHRYLTIDHWASIVDYEAFLSHWKSEYETLDEGSKDLTERETLLGKWEYIRRETG
jgi:heme-degrading monooxygenase HmoA